MARNFSSRAILGASDGSQQSRRALPALDPDHAPLDGRSLEDLITFALKLSTGIAWHDATDKPAGDWLPFFCLDPASPPTPPHPNTIPQDAAKLAAYLRDPASAAATPTLHRNLTRPQLALFLTFLHQRLALQAQFNTLTGRHLDFFYRTCLGLNPAPPTPDKVHVLLQPAPAVPAVKLAAGTMLSAGKDSTGKSLVYATDHPVTVNHASIAQLKTCFCLKRWLGLASARLTASSPQDACSAMITMAVGTTWQVYPSGMTSFDDVRTALTSNSPQPAQSYLRRSLFVSEGEFWTLTDLWDSAAKPLTGAQWLTLETILTSAHERRVLAERAQRLQEINLDTNLSDPLTAMFIAAVGEWQGEKGAKTLGLPSIPETCVEAGKSDLQALYDALTSTDIPPAGTPTVSLTEAQSDAQQAAADATRYVQDELCLSLAAFERIMQTNANADPRSATNTPPARTVPIPSDQAGIQAFYATLSPGEKSWDYVYSVLEYASRVKRHEPIPPVGQEAWVNLYAAPDATALLRRRPDGPAGDSPSWKTLGGLPECLHPDAVAPGALGFAIASPVLALSAGLRVVTLTVTFEPRGFAALDTSLLSEALTVQFTTATGWQTATTPAIRPIGSLNPKVGVAYPSATLKDTTLTVSSTDPALQSTDVGKYFVPAKSTAIYQIIKVTSATEATVEEFDGPLEILQAPASGTLFATDAVQPSNLQFTFTLSPQDPALAPLGTGAAGAVSPWPAAWPAVRILLADQPLDEDTGSRLGLSKPLWLDDADLPASVLRTLQKVKDRAEQKFPAQPVTRKDYEAFRKLCVTAVTVDVSVGQTENVTDAASLQGLSRDLWLENDDSTLDATKPFLPWSSTAATGARFNLAHPELCNKPLTSLSLVFDWVGVPTNLLDGYYANYGSAAGPLSSTAPPNAALQLCQEGSVLAVNNAGKLSLFADTGTVTQPSSPPQTATISFSTDFTYSEYPDALPTAPSDFAAWRRYWILRLGTPDFQVAAYPAAATAAAQSVPPTTVNPPYVPKAQCLTVGYTSSASLKLGKSDCAPVQVFHVLPFGFTPVTGVLVTQDAQSGLDVACEHVQRASDRLTSASPATDASATTDGETLPTLYPFLPTVENAGALHLGIASLRPPAPLSLLFQLAEGSADPEAQGTDIQWSYLRGDRWVEFPPHLVQDTTDGLRHTGVVEFQVPADATTVHTLMPAGLHWLRASTVRGATGVCDTVAVLPQAVLATFVDQGNAADHYTSALPPGSITRLGAPQPAILSVTQPYSSSGGAPAEDGTAFLTRVSERLRHKARPLQPWDYERLTLGRFPGVHSALCLPGAPGSGAVEVIVVPDMQGRVPFDPFRPKVAADVVDALTRSLQAGAPPTATVQVRNPVYIPVLVRVDVRLQSWVRRPEQALFALDRALKRYLAPWAYDPQAQITFNGCIYADAIIAFLQQRPEVSACQNVQLFQRLPGQREWTQCLGDPLCASAPQPGTILTSAPDHALDLITTKPGTEPPIEDGIGYWIIGLDFQVTAPSPTP